MLAPSNSSPKTGNDPIAYLCRGRMSDLNPGFTDQNGDFLKFQLVSPRTNSIIPNITDVNILQFKPGLSATNPMPSQNGFVFDSTTGQISFIPSQEINGVIAIKISEFRNGKLIGSTMLDITLLVRNCENEAPTISGFDNGSEYDKLICIGDSITTEFTSTDSDGGDSVRFSWNKGLPGGELKLDSGVSLAKAVLTWKPTLADTGIRNFTITTFDDGCPAIGTTTKTFTFKVRVKPEINFIKDTLIDCGATVSIGSNVISGISPISFSWPGRSDNTQFITVGHGVYTAKVQDASGCFMEDTIRVMGSSINPYILIDTSCLVEGVQLTALAFSFDTTLTFTYEWTFPPESQIFTGKVLRRKFPTAGLRNVTLKIKASDNCTVTYSSQINVCNPPPVIAQYAPNVCQGQSLNLGCGVPGRGGVCGALTICVILTARNWISFPGNGFITFPPDSLKPDSNTFEVITYSFDNCTNKKKFKFRVKPSPRIKFLPNKDRLVFNCNKPDTTILIKIFKDFRFLNDSLWGKITYLDTVINLPKTKNDTIYYSLKLNKPCSVVVEGIMKNNCNKFKYLDYLPEAIAYISTSGHCNVTDSVQLYPIFSSVKFTNYIINIGNGSTTTDSIPKIFYPPNQIYKGYFAIEDSLGCKDTSDFTVDTRMPDSTVIVSADSACKDGFIRFNILDTNLVHQWRFSVGFETSTLPKGKMADSLLFEFPGTNFVKVTMSYKSGCIRTWDLPPIYVRQPIWPSATVSNVCAYDSTRILGTISFSEHPISKWKWKYTFPSGVNLGFSEDTIQNPVRLFNYNGKFRSILEVIDIKGCLARDTLDSNMVLVSKPEFDVNGNCQNDSLVFFFGKVPDQFENIDRFTYIYNDGLTESTGNGQGLHQFQAPGVYKIKLIAYSEEGCFNIDSTILEIKPRPKAVFEFPPLEICQGQQFFVDGRNSIPAAPGENLVSYTWATNEENPISSDTSTSASIFDAGKAFIALQVRSTNGCQDYLKFSFDARPRPIPDFAANEDDLANGDKISFSDLSVGGNKWRWDFGDGNQLLITDSNQTSPSHSYTFGSNFTVKQWVINSFGCADSVSKEVNLKSFIALPNAFSPNGDGRNDGLGIIHRFVKELVEFKIYNRLGQVVFDGNGNITARWNGDLGGVSQPNGSYLYIAKAKSVFGENLELKGSITLIR